MMDYYIVFLAVLFVGLVTLAVWAAKALERRQEEKIVIGADYSASYTIRNANPWQPAEIMTWKVKVVDVKDGYVKYFHYLDDGGLWTESFEVAPVYKFEMLYTLVEPQ